MQSEANFVKGFANIVLECSMPRAGDSIKWIEAQPFFSELSMHEKQEAGSFGFIWGIYEHRVMNVLGKSSNVSLSKEVCQEYILSSYLPRASLTAEKAFFRRQFFENNGEPNRAWEDAGFRDSDKKEEIRIKLIDNDGSFQSDAEALIRVVIRLRNNFFHGFKWAYNMRGQLENFTYANAVLIKTMPQT